MNPSHPLNTLLLTRIQNSPEHKILPNEKFGVKATLECKTPSNETTIKDDSHRKIQVRVIVGGEGVWDRP